MVRAARSSGDRRLLDEAGERLDQLAERALVQQVTEVVHRLLGVHADEADAHAPVPHQPPEDRIGHQRQARRERQQDHQQLPVR